MLSKQDAVAPKFTERHVLCKEEYLYITWTSRAGATRAIQHAEYGKAQRRDKRQGIWVLGSQVLSEAAGTGLRRRVRAAVAEWATATIHFVTIQDVARVFTERVLAQVVARTQGALPTDTNVYRLAAPMGRVDEEDPSALQAGLRHTLADPVACFLGTASTDRDVQGSGAVAATGHEHDPTSTVSVVHSSVVPTRGGSDGKRAWESAQRNRLGDS